MSPGVLAIARCCVNLNPLHPWPPAALTVILLGIITILSAMRHGSTFLTSMLPVLPGEFHCSRLSWCQVIQFFLFFSYLFLFIWLHWVLTVACKIFDLHYGIQDLFSCGMWNLVP